MKKIFLMCLLLFGYVCLAQFSKTHYIPPLSGSDNPSSSAQEQYLYISTPSVSTVRFKIIALGGSTVNGTVSKSAPYVYNVGYGTNTQLMLPRSQVSSIVSNKGYIVEAEDLVYVAVRLIAGNSNQSGSLVSKGLAALGTQFRIGSLLNVDANPLTDNHYTFVSVLATENNTLVQFEDIRPGASLINNATAGNTPAFITLNSGESFVMAVEGPLDANRDALIGSAVISDKPVAVNCGSFCGSNAVSNLDCGFDQIVSAERTGKDYIFIKSTGQAPVERVLLVANEDNTQIFLSGSSFPAYILNAGDYIALDGNDFTAQGNLYVRSSKNIFAYQTIGDDSRTDFANQKMFFVPPLSCETPHIIDNVPLINQIGSRSYPISRITLVTEIGSTVNVEVDGVSYSIGALAFIPGVSVNGPISVNGNPNYVTYIITGLTGNIGAFSTSQLYMAAYGTDGAATFGGFYSGFTFKPEITFALLNPTQTNCIPNTELSVNSLSPFDVFQWFFNDIPIFGATSSSYSPIQPGYYHVQATIANCGTTLISDNIPISSCPLDFDNDAVNNNIDLDNDNDGILDCTESLGNQDIDLSDASILNVVTGGPDLPSPIPFAGQADGTFVTEAAIGKNNTVSFRKDFAVPTSISLEYVTTASGSDLLNEDGDFTLDCDVSKTITVLNPNNQLLIDTNFDGIYESGVTKFSSFEVRFRLNSSVPLLPGTGTFQLKSSLTASISLTHKNLSDASPNRATFKLIATCVPKDSDGDGVTDNFDSDSDNDGISDAVESHGATAIVITTTDNNNDGLYDVYGSGTVPVDTDADGVPDYLDLDSDNDGIYDLVESGSTVADTNLNGMIDGNTASFGSNGLSDSVETAPDSGILTYTVADSDGDGVNNYLEIDSDNDGCFDTIEAGFTNSDSDGLLGSGTPVTDTKGVVTNAVGYTALTNANYTIAAPIAINTQPVMAPVCKSGNTSATIGTTPVDSYQWQLFSGGVWTDLADDVIYSGTQTNTLQITGATLAMDGSRYQVKLQKNGNSCGAISSETMLTVYPLPVITSPQTLIECDEDAVSDGVTDINLRQKESFISSNSANLTFDYFTSLAAAQAGNTSLSNPDYISNPLQFNSGNTIVYVRVSTDHSCYRIATLNVSVSSTRIPASFHLNYYECDDFLDTNGNNNANNDNHDGIAFFDFSAATAALTAVLPTSNTFTIKYYKDVTDANSVTDASGNSLEISQNPADPISIYHYRNIDSPNQTEIWVRVQSGIANDCFGLGAYISLIIEPLPVVHPVNAINTIHHCDDDQDGIYGFDTSAINPAILGGQTNVSLSYFDAAGTPLPSPLPNPFSVHGSATITVKAVNNITNAPDGPCSSEGSFTFVVDSLPQAMPVNSALLTACDDETNPLLQNGIFAFDTTGFESTILNGQTGVIIRYTDGNGDPLPNPLPNPFMTATQNVTATVENPLATGCTATQVLAFKVNPLPLIKINGDDGLICKNREDGALTLDAGVAGGIPVTNYTYQWYLDDVILNGETSPTILADAGGIYSVEVTNSSGCSRIHKVKVLVSEIATVDHVEIIDLTENNSVRVITTGTGDYLYSLDFDNAYQDSNYFANVPGGVHQVYVKDVNGCGTAGPVEIYVISAPDFFTPNGDGYNDTWNIHGIDGSHHTATVYIFNRDGKLLKQLSPSSAGWDGNFNGKQMPSDDYWYSVTIDGNRIARGHFALTR